MKLDVKNLMMAQTGEKQSFNVELYNEELDEDVLAERIKGELTVTNIEGDILAKFNGLAKVKTVCDRCLAEFKIDVEVDFSQEYTRLPIEPVEAEEKYPISKNFEIDITEPLRQTILSKLPVKKLCKEDCKGICAGCGKDLNIEKCKCKKVKK